MDFANRNILILGYGLEGKATFSYLESHFENIKIYIADQNSNLVIDQEIKDKVTEIFLGDDFLNALKCTDIVIRSPGIPLNLIKDYISKHNLNVKLTSATQIFLSRHRDRTIGITGTKGKSTTSSLIYEILKDSGKNVLLVGNIGSPALKVIDELPDYFIYEMSSYQLQDLTTSPHIALFLNIYPEHLDHHGNFEAYFNAKSCIYKNQVETDTLFVNSEIKLNEVISRVSHYDKNLFKIREQVIYDNSKNVVFDSKKSKLKGIGNLNNIMCVLNLVKYLELDFNKAIYVIYNFNPLPHRLEVVGKVDGITFINDSISTVPQATINALEAYGNDTKFLILGGYDRGVDYQILAKEILKYNIKKVLLFKPSGERIFNALETYIQINSLTGIPQMLFVNSMKEAIEVVLKDDQNDGICLLSPASPSFGLFKNFEERGRIFKEILIDISLAI